MSLKDITDAEKPWFDYVSYLLKIGAWALAIAYAAHQQFRPRPPGAALPIFEWIGIFLAGCFAVFLVVRLVKMSLRMSKEIIDGLTDSFFNRYVLVPVIGIWIFFAMPAFTIAVTGEVVELYLEKYAYPKATSELKSEFQTPPSLVGPWGRPRFTSPCPTGAVIAGTTTLCPIVPTEWN